jgi:scyllo-inositol 2-dehydrogenase (NADP+)
VTARRIRVGLVGFGLAGAVFHAPLIAAVDRLVLDAVLTRDPERSADAQRRHPDVRVVASFDELLETGPDLVVIASPNRTHAPLAVRAIEAGCAVVVDKPLATTAAEAHAVVSLAASADVLLGVFHNRRWDNDFLTVRGLIERGELGEVLRYESRFERWRPAVADTWRERPEPEEGGGMLLDLGSHLVDQALLLFGPAATVYGEVDRRREGARVDDDCFIALTHASGVRSQLWMSSNAAQRGPRLRVLGSAAGYVKWGVDPQEAALRAGGRPEPGTAWGLEPVSAWGRLGTDDGARIVPSVAGNYRAYYDAIAAALLEHGAPPVAPDDAVAGLVVLEAARRSSAEGRVVRLS